ncbi:hypothetical protein FLAN108750_07535 [Flavobacterium antarcticum]|uniref:hypothetical protein n=1 Tax=Flavobacterium antarcticum TaxID=271155 RepID=UPI0003B6E555|nr:hypothetical protein [Flavobacterium antarcticum]
MYEFFSCEPFKVPEKDFYKIDIAINTYSISSVRFSLTGIYGSYSEVKNPKSFYLNDLGFNLVAKTGVEPVTSGL